MKVPERYTESLFYQIELTSKYFKYLINQVFEKLDIKISPDNFAVLDILIQAPDICQRDLAKILLKDRANTGKIVNSLEEKGLVKRFIDIKGKRLVKKLRITDEGHKCVKEISEKTKYIAKLFDKQVMHEEQTKVKQSLMSIRSFLKENIETNI